MQSLVNIFTKKKKRKGFVIPYMSDMDIQRSNHGTIKTIYFLKIKIKYRQGRDAFCFKFLFVYHRRLFFITTLN